MVGSKSMALSRLLVGALAVALLVAGVAWLAGARGTGTSSGTVTAVVTALLLLDGAVMLLLAWALPRSHVAWMLAVGGLVANAGAIVADQMGLIDFTLLAVCVAGVVALILARREAGPSEDG